MPKSRPDLLNRQPLYLQISRQVILAIESGEWSDGEMLPSEWELAERFRVSQGTVRKGLDKLVQDGVLARRQGLGTFVNQVDEDWGGMLVPDTKDGHTTSCTGAVELLSCARSNAADEVAAALGLRRAAALFVVRRLARIAGEPFAVIESHVAADRFEGLDARRIKQAGGNLRKVWLKEFGFRLVSDLPCFRVVRTTREDAALLTVGDDTHLLEVVRTASLADGEVVEYSVFRCRTDQFAYAPRQPGT